IRVRAVRPEVTVSPIGETGARDVQVLIEAVRCVASSDVGVSGIGIGVVADSPGGDLIRRIVAEGRGDIRPRPGQVVSPILRALGWVVEIARCYRAPRLP